MNTNDWISHTIQFVQLIKNDWILEEAGMITVRSALQLLGDRASGQVTLSPGFFQDLFLPRLAGLIRIPPTIT